MTRRVAVVGGGITGLAAAYEARATAPDAEIVVYEAADRFGGKVDTSPFAGRRLDGGADAFLARVPWALELCRELGLDATLVSPAQQAAYVWFRGALRRLPAGLVLGVPTDFEAVRASGIVEEPITPHPFSAPLAPEDDLSVGALVRAQLGDAVFERLVDPLLGGINAGDADHLSLRAGAPQLAAAAERDGDLVAALRTQPAAAPGPVFYAPVGGMAAIVDALVDALRATNVSLLESTLVTDVASIDADAVIVATPSYRAADLLRRRTPATAKILDSIEYASVILVSMAFPRAALTRPLDASGFLVPRTEGLLMTATSWSSSKWSHLDEGDTVLLRVSVGRYGDDRPFALDESALVDRLVEEARETSGIATDPAEVRVTRWPRSFPQYEPGHLDRVDAIEHELARELPHVVVTGAAMRGLGVPACIRQGREAARTVLA
jgi:oxygen-dependent protoporphyrinogen oxidase